MITTQELFNTLSAYKAPKIHPFRVFVRQALISLLLVLGILAIVTVLSAVMATFVLLCGTSPGIASLVAVFLFLWLGFFLVVRYV